MNSYYSLSVSYTHLDVYKRQTQERYWCIQGPGLETGDEWRYDHALFSWRFFWDIETRRRGLSAAQVPRVIERYPYLAGGKPAMLPGIDELQEIARNAVIVSTACLLYTSRCV